MINELYLYAQSLDCGARMNEPMAGHTSFKVGGPADLFLEPDSVESLKKILRFAQEKGIRWQVIGNGSNLLVPDEGVRGAVIRIGERLSEMRLETDTSILCGAGVSLSRLCIFAMEHGLTGLEFAYGIPGSAGGAAYMNAGAYDGEMKDVLAACEHVDEEGVGRYEGEALQLSYRTSVYTGGEKIITALHLQLQHGAQETIKARMKELISRRKEKQPLEYPSAGSTFKRPAGQYAGALIEGCGLKGKRIGGAEVSEKHAGFIINTGGATSADILDLIAFVQKTVLKETGVVLETEVKVLR